MHLDDIVKQYLIGDNGYDGEEKDEEELEYNHDMETPNDTQLTT